VQFTSEIDLGRGHRRSLPHSLGSAATPHIRSRPQLHAGYVAGNLAISVIAGLVSYTTLSLLGVGFAAPLAVIVSVFDLLPLIGAMIAAIIVGVVTLFHSFPTDTIIWAIVVIVYQQAENNLLSPVLYRRTVQVPGMLVLISVLIGTTLGGVIGALLAIPAAAAIQIVVRDMRQQPQEPVRQVSM
jgi:predicted PurR-regulated permease PerM